MLTPEITAHFDAPLSIAVGAADDALKPAFARVFALISEADTSRLSVVVPVKFADRLFASLKHDGRIAINAADVSTFYTLQFKGTVETMRPATAEEEALALTCKAKTAEKIGELWGAQYVEGWMNMVEAPAMTLTVGITDIFDQTPGKTAGRRLA